MQIEGNAIQQARVDVFEQTARKMNQQVYLKAEEDLDKMLDKMIKQAGFR
jgi:L-lactate utilization protein LutC